MSKMSTIDRSVSYKPCSRTGATRVASDSGKSQGILCWVRKFEILRKVGNIGKSIESQENLTCLYMSYA